MLIAHCVVPNLVSTVDAEMMLLLMSRAKSIQTWLWQHQVQGHLGTLMYKPHISDKVIEVKARWATFVAKHNLSFLSSDHATMPFSTMFFRLRNCCTSSLSFFHLLIGLTQFSRSQLRIPPLSFMLR